MKADNPIIREFKDIDTSHANEKNDWMVSVKDPDAAHTMSYLQYGEALANKDTAAQPKNPARKLGKIYFKDGEREFHTVAAGDAIPMDENGNILMILRANPPGKGLPCLAGGFVDPAKGSGEIENIIAACMREVQEETNLDADSKQVFVVNGRKLYRPDNREAINDSLQTTQKINKGDIFGVSTAGVLMIVPGLYEKINGFRATIKPGDDAAKTFLMSVDQIEQTGVPDHLDLIHEAVLQYPEKFKPQIVEKIALKRLLSAEDRILKDERAKYVAKNLYNNFVNKSNAFNKADNQLYKDLEKQAELHVTRGSIRDLIAAEKDSIYGAVAKATGKTKNHVQAVYTGYVTLEKASSIATDTAARVAGTFALAGNMIRKGFQMLEDVHVVRDLTTRVNATLIENAAQKISKMGESFAQASQGLSEENRKAFDNFTNEIIDANPSSLAEAHTKYNDFISKLLEKDKTKIAELDKLGNDLVKAKTTYLQLLDNQADRADTIKQKEIAKKDSREAHDKHLADIPGVKEMRENIQMAKSAAYRAGTAVKDTAIKAIDRIRGKGSSNER